MPRRSSARPTSARARPALPRPSTSPRSRAEKPEEAAKLQTQLDENGYIVKAPNSNLAAPLLAGQLGGTFFLAFISAVAFATILAVVAGLTIAASGAFAHDVWFNIVKKGVESEQEQLVVARITAVVIGSRLDLLGARAEDAQRRVPGGARLRGGRERQRAVDPADALLAALQQAGVLAGMMTGLVSSLALIAISPAIMGVDPPTAAVRHLIQAPPIFPLDNPAIVSVPLGFIAAIVVALLTHDRKRNTRSTNSGSREPRHRR